MWTGVRFFFGIMVVLAAGQAGAQGTGKEYPDGHGGTVYFPQGDISFADELVSFEVGSPDAGEASAAPESALGVPDYEAVSKPGYLTLGCGGVLILAFTDNVLLDIPGPDLYVFEIGPNVEPTGLAISPDGQTWTRVGKIAGATAEIDIAPYVPRGATFRYVKLVDLKQACGSYPGADIDTVGAIGSATKISLDSSVLFDTGKYELKESAVAALSEALADVKPAPGTAVIVEGHTDNVGSDADNQTLSENRATSVAGFLTGNVGFAADAVETRAYGESRPIADNETAEGRQKNRRVELTIVSNPPERATDEPEEIIYGIWETTEGMMEMRREGDRVAATYDKGKIVGQFTSDTVFEGHWVQEHSDQTCSEQREGTDHWGAIRFTFDSPARDTFTGAWSYCEAEPTSTGWDGKRLL